MLTVVMCVYNGAELLERSLKSVLTEQALDMEVVLVNDGSNDSTGDLARSYAKADQRLRVIENERNEGITRSLIKGCRIAGGRYIARQDAGDVSARDRFAKQAEVLETRKNVAIVSSWVRYEGPGGERAGGIKHDPGEADAALSITSANQRRVRGPYHGAAMFRRSDYEAVGGYRQQFYFAQDVDLWLRLHERGIHWIIPEELYTARLAPESISGRHRAEQDKCLDLAVRSAWARRAGESEQPWLDQASAIVPPTDQHPGRMRRLRALSLYSMGCQLRIESPGSAGRYFIESIKVYPFNPKAWVRLAENLCLRGRGCLTER